MSLTVGLSAVLISGTVGLLLGLVSGFFGGWLDDVIMRIADIQLSFPTILLALAIMAVLGSGLDKLILVLGLTGWVQYGRIVRGQVLSMKQEEFVLAARATGERNWRILFEHILPNIWSPVIVIASFSVATNIVAEASLSFLGVGVPPSVPSWGTMLADGRQFIGLAEWLTIPAGPGDLAHGALDQHPRRLAARFPRSAPEEHHVAGDRRASSSVGFGAAGCGRNEHPEERSPPRSRASNAYEMTRRITEFYRSPGSAGYHAATSLVRDALIEHRLRVEETHLSPGRRDRCPGPHDAAGLGAAWRKYRRRQPGAATDRRFRSGRLVRRLVVDLDPGGRGGGGARRCRHRRARGGLCRQGPRRQGRLRPQRELARHLVARLRADRPQGRDRHRH